MIAWGARLIPPDLNDESLGDMLDMLLTWNVRYLERVGAPALYASGARYLPERRGEEQWRSIPHLLANGGGVCHSLACYRAAELRVAGFDAFPVWTVEARFPDGSIDLVHVRVFIAPCSELPKGAIDDPSLRLGMSDVAASDPWLH